MYLRDVNNLVQSSSCSMFTCVSFKMTVQSMDFELSVSFVSFVNDIQNAFAEFSAAN